MHADAGVAGVAAAAPARAAPLAADGLASAENAQIDTHTHSQPVEKKKSGTTWIHTSNKSHTI